MDKFALCTLKNFAVGLYTAKKTNSKKRAPYRVKARKNRSNLTKNNYFFLNLCLFAVSGTK